MRPVPPHVRAHPSRGSMVAACGAWLLGLAMLVVAVRVRAFGEAGAVDLRVLLTGAATTASRPTATQRLAWEVHKRTSVELRLKPSVVRLDAPDLFESPFVYWSVLEPVAPLTDGEVVGLRRFVELGGFVLIDDASEQSPEVDRSLRRELARAFPHDGLHALPSDHVIYRSFYLVRRPVGRRAAQLPLEAIVRGDRVAVVYSRHDLGGAWERSDAGQFLYPVLTGGERQREEAYRFGVNLVMYALCLDYKDDQVHVPFIMRRQAFAP